MKIKKFLIIPILSSFVSLAYAQDLKLVYAVDVIRHGARAPLQFMPNTDARYQWQASPGQLLPLGLHQTYLLGINARNYYVNSKNFLPQHYDLSLLHEVTLYSTNFNRTLQSAQAFSQGLYPLGTGPKDYQPKMTAPPLPQAMAILPVHFDETVSIASSSPAKSKAATQKLLLKIIKALPKNNKCIALYNNAKNDGSLARWGKASGFKFTGSILSDFSAFVNFGDNVVTRKSLGIPLPRTVQAPFAQGDEQKVARIVNACYSTIYRFTSVAKITSGKLLTAIIHNMKNVAARKTSLRYNLYSSHDANVAALMTLLGLPLSGQPPFASNVRLELYQVGDTHKYIVQLTYNKVLQTFPQSICGKAAKSCDFVYFEKLTQAAQQTSRGGSK